MLLRLSRLSFWLAAAVAAFALLAPREREHLLAVIAAAAGLIAFTLLRAALRAEMPEPVARAAPVAAPVLGGAILVDATAQLMHNANAAPSFEAALHAVARLLCGELGAHRAVVLVVKSVGADHAEVSELVEFQPGFQTVPRRIPLDAAPLGQVLRDGGEAADLPASAALAVRAAGRVVAAIELSGLDLPVEPLALTQLLGVAQRVLSKIATRPSAGARVRPGPAAQRRAQLAGVQVLVIVGVGEAESEFTARALRRLGCRFSVAFGMLDGLNALRRTQFGLILIDTQMSAATVIGSLRQLKTNPGSVSVCDTPVIALFGPGLPGDEERFRELGFDDHLSKPFRRRKLLAMLSKHVRSPVPTASTDPAESADAARPQSSGEPVLDPSALARLAELDPTGANRLLERVLQAFQTSVARLRPQFDAARRSDDRAAIRLVAHTLKSSSASIGALRFSQLCAQIETAIRLDAPDALSGPLGEFDAALESALQAIDTVMKERA